MRPTHQPRCGPGKGAHEIQDTTRKTDITDLEVLEDADRRARRYVAGAAQRRVYPDGDALAGLSAFDEPPPEIGRGPQEKLERLDDIGSPGTVVSNGPNYFGFVIGATLPAAAVAERMMTAWDQCASSFDNSPVADLIEKTAARWILDVLNLPRDSAVSFGTSASAGGLACLTAARRSLLARQGWDFDADGLVGAPGNPREPSELSASNAAQTPNERDRRSEAGDYACPSRRTAKALKIVQALVFLGLGGWCLLAPHMVEALALRREYQNLSDTTALLMGCFGAQAMLCGALMLLARFTARTFLIFGLLASVPFFVFKA